MKTTGTMTPSDIATLLARAEKSLATIPAADTMVCPDLRREAEHHMAALRREAADAGTIDFCAIRARAEAAEVFECALAAKRWTR